MLYRLVIKTVFVRQLIGYQLGKARHTVDVRRRFRVSMMSKVHRTSNGCLQCSEWI